jgi:hypothetical protein
VAISFVGNALGPTNSTTSFDITLPTTQSGDLLILEFCHRGTGQGTLGGTGGSGWTRKTGITFGSFSVQQYYKICDGSESGDTLSVSGLTNASAGIVTQYRGIDPAAPFDVDPTGESNASGNESHAGITTNTNGAWVCLVVGNSPDLAVTSQSSTSPGALTARAERLSTGGTDASIAHASAAKASAGATGNLTWAQTNAASGSLAYALKPEPVIVTISGAFDSALADADAALSGSVVVVVSGAMAATLEAVDAALAGSVSAAVYAGTFASTLADFASDLSGVVITTGEFASTLEEFDAALAGGVVISGAFATTLSDIEPLVEEDIFAEATNTGSITINDTVTELGQTFDGANRTLISATARMSRLGSSNGSLVCGIWLADENGEPVGDPLEESSRLASSISTSATAQTFDFSGVALEAGQSYIALFYATGTTDFIFRLGSGSGGRALTSGTWGSTLNLTSSITVGAEPSFVGAVTEATVTVSGAFAATLSDATADLAGDVTEPVVTVTGAMASTLADAAMDATGLVIATGALASALEPATMDASGIVIATGSFESTLEAHAASLSGVVLNAGAFETELAAFTADLNGAVQAPTVDGEFAATLAALDAALAGAVINTGAFASSTSVSAAFAGAVADNVVEGAFASSISVDAAFAGSIVGEEPVQEARVGGGGFGYQHDREPAVEIAEVRRPRVIVSGRIAAALEGARGAFSGRVRDVLRLPPRAPELPTIRDSRITKTEPVVEAAPELRPEVDEFGELLEALEACNAAALDGVTLRVSRRKLNA